ncbi:atypical/PIKK/FRAP protein kinase [Auricularia subglabra TFB-10046 SS5]|nr:atypical/PIKK/FRAP protein kinase [Auricularia subglabra TFB-10046 SS5]
MATELPSKLWDELRSKLPETRAAASRELHDQVASVMAELSAEAAWKLWDEHISRKLFELIKDKQAPDALGALLAMDVLSEYLEGEELVELGRILFRFWNYLLLLFPNVDNSLMIAASRTAGKVVKSGGSSFGEAFIDKELPRAVDLLSAIEKDPGRYGGVLLLRELARTCPSHVYKHVPDVLAKLFPSFKDTRSYVREGAAELLGTCLEILNQRERIYKGPLVVQVLGDAQNALKASSSTEAVHGALLEYRALFLHAGPFMREHFAKSCESIFQFRNHKEVLIRRSVVMLIPTLAAYDTPTFCENFLHTSMSYLLSQLSKPSERSFAFVAIGHIAKPVRSEIKSFLEPIMKNIKDGLQQCLAAAKKGGQAGAMSEEPLFQCIGMLATSVGPNLTRFLHDQLDLIFNCPLTEPLHQALVAIARHIDPLLRPIQERLLDMLSLILVGQAYKPIGPTRQDSAPAAALAAGSTSSRDPQQLKLALDILGSFDFSGHVLNEFVRSAALPYLEDDNAGIRHSAALTCCKLFVKEPIWEQSSLNSAEIIHDVLGKLLMVGVADPAPDIRLTVLSNLDEKFDRHLAQAEHVRAVFVAVNDEVFENRLAAIRLVGRLAQHNPAYIMPSLRKAICQLMAELEYSPTARGKEEASRLVTALAGGTQPLIRPYALGMLRVLLPKAEDPNPEVAAQAIVGLGELASVGGEDYLDHVPELMRIVIACLKDSSVEKRDAALKALGQICSNTGYVVQPLVDWPELLPSLVNILGGQEQSQDVKREVVKVMGILGAIDPYRRKGSKVEESPLDSNAVRLDAVQASVPLGGSANEEYYQSVVIHSLLRVLKDPSLSTSSYAAIDAIMSIFKTQGLKGAIFLDKVLPAFIAVIRSSTSRFQETYLQQLALLVGMVKQHIRVYLPEIFKLTEDLWSNSSLQVAIVGVVEALAKALDTEFRPFLPTVLPTVLRVFEGEHNSTEKRQQAQIQTLRAFIAFGSNIEEYLHLVIPVIVRACEGPQSSIALRKQAVLTIDMLSRRLNFSDHVSRIIHPLVRALAIVNQELRASIMDTLCALVFQLGSEFAIFVPMINKCLLRNRIVHPKYEELIAKLLNGERLPQEFGQIEFNDSQTPEIVPAADLPNHPVNQQHLKQAWDTSGVSSRDDWLEWYRRVSMEFLKESPSHALRACANLLDPGMSGGKELARDLFNVSFLSCYTELYENYQTDLVAAIEGAIGHGGIPSEVVIALLNLAEFMEHQDVPLPIDSRVWGELAFDFHAYAKALHYKELEYFNDTSHAVMESLLNINTKLQQHDAAFGTLKAAKMTAGHVDLVRHEEWFERLGRWQEALEGYNRMAEADPESFSVATGRMRCLHALGEWEQLARLVDDNWDRASHEDRKALAPLAAAAAWSLSDWDAMDDYIAAMSHDSPDRFFYRAILSVHRNHFPKAVVQIQRARDLIESEFTPLLGEDYGRSYNAMIHAQMLSELEEIITYKQCSDQPERQETIRKTWMRRLQGCQPEVDVWQRVLQVRALVLSPVEDNAMWIKFANLCRKKGRMYLANKTFNAINPPNAQEPIRVPPEVVYSRLKYMWANNEKQEALTVLLDFSEDLGRLVAHSDGHSWDAQDPEQYTKLLARCYMKQGEWQTEMTPAWVENSEKVLTAFELATQHDPLWYKAWHTWALANIEVIGHAESHATRVEDDVPDSVVARTVAAVEGLLRSIALGKQSSLQDALRLLTLWFKFGHHDDVSHAVGSGFSMVSVDTWLDVIPQIIARIQTPSVNIGRNINFLLNDIGKQHPQALVYPLTVASKSPSASRKDAAARIMDRMKDHSSTLVEQALIVSRELIRVAILWHEMWHEGLEEASRLYFTEKNPEAMIAVLDPLHDLMDRGPTTSREISFIHAFGRDLLDARRACHRYRMYGETRELDKAWDIYYMVFRKVEKQLPLLTTLDLQYVSPALLEARNLVLAVPGTYQSGKRILRIQSFSSKLAVISSKKRPRRLTVKGDDGHEYEFGLKGNEDLRQDERAMQFFGLVNTLLSNDPDSYTRQLHIQRMPVIPLAPNAGLSGWVRDTDTLHVLVRDYRESRKLLINQEMRLMLQMAPDYEDLTLLQKVEVFQYAMDNTLGQDLYRVLWLKSISSETWLAKRTTFTRSMAATSMLGYVLGLGDRHPSNILMHRGTGKIVHIDYGDCFEVTMVRDKYPEKVPFRLTRMLVNAMEVTGVHGSFKNSCEIIVRVLRKNRDSLLAVLEAFVYDPLISWRLVQTDGDALEGRDNSDIAEGQDGYADGPTRRQRADENDIFNETIGRPGAKQEVRNESALSVYNRVQNKLTGRDFNPDVVLSIPTQVDKLIQQARAIENLCQHFPGWCAYW